VEGIWPASSDAAALRFVSSDGTANAKVGSRWKATGAVKKGRRRSWRCGGRSATPAVFDALDPRT